MALPPKGDPRRPLHLAILSTRLLGIVLLLFGTCGVSSFLMTLTRSSRGGPGVGEMWILVGASLFYFVPGALFLVFSIFLGRRQHWAVVCGLVLSSLMGLFVLFALVGFVLAVLRRAGEEPAVWMAVPLTVIALFGLAFGQLIYHLSKSFEAIKHPPFGQEVRGFEPLPVRPLVPPPTEPPSPANP
jgi:hypothetical protein